MPGFTNVYIDLTSPQLGGGRGRRRCLPWYKMRTTAADEKEGAATDSTHSKGGGRGDRYHALIPLREKSPRGANEQASPSQTRSAQLRQHMKSHCQNDSATVITGVTRLSKAQHNHCRDDSAAMITGAIEDCQNDSTVTAKMAVLPR